MRGSAAGRASASTFRTPTGTWTAALGDGRWRLRARRRRAPCSAWLEQVGEVPLPPYIRRPDGPTAADRERYQTVFARVPGAVAAPTAGLHFTPALLASARRRAGSRTSTLTLHVGPGTFLPVRGGDLDDAHGWSRSATTLPAATRGADRGGARARRPRRRRRHDDGARARVGGGADGRCGREPVRPALFIRPGHRFRVVDALLTNFHLPRHDAAGAGRRLRRARARCARPTPRPFAQRYRFYSYGDAMLIT